MEFRTLEIFHAVAMSNSFGRAAAVLHMTQSAVSQRIGNLEAELGSRLFDRTNRGATLTPKGHVLLSYCRTLLATRTEMLQALADMLTENNIIRLGVSETIAQTWLPVFISEVSTRYPFVTFEIDVDVSTNMRSRLLRQELDIAFLLGAIIEPGIGNAPLSSYPVCFAASTSLGLDGDGVTPAKMAQHALICFPRNTVIYGVLQQMFRDRGIRPPQIHCSSSVATIIKMTLDGIGISVLTPSLITEHLASRRLMTFASPITLPSLEYSVSYRTGSANKMAPLIASIAGKVAQDYALAH